MSRVTVQCKGSGQSSGSSLNAKRANCTVCGRTVDVRPDGKFRKHTRQTTTARLRKGA